ncbi:MAG: Long-chain-fatty-acid--CoA ligase FadD15 [Owenweeksia sp. TMED14]|nr:MAG: Long-chain-fatty-acid--CoA ligase FadD15 [Owenweeksia sp. TMED14]
MKLLFLKGVLESRGWEYRDKLPIGIKKFVLVVGPHTSWRDFFVGLCIRTDLEMFSMRFLAKSNLFYWPFSFFLKALGAIPVDRKNSNGIVNQISAEFKTNDRLIYTLAPEGTRSKVDLLKSGYYNIAKESEVPIIILGIDFGRKMISVSSPYYPVDLNESNNHILEIIGPLQGRNMELGLGHLIPDRSNRTLPEKFCWNAKNFPQRLFLDEPNSFAGRLQFTFKGAYEEALCFSNGLLKLGIAVGDRVAILGNNSAHWIIADNAISQIGAVSVPLYPNIAPESLKEILEHSGSKAIIFCKLEFPENYFNYVPESCQIITAPYLKLSPASLSKHHQWSNMTRSKDLTPHSYEPRSNDLMTIIYTSGTTGKPKGVMHNYGAFQAAFKIITSHFDFLHQEIFFSYLPLCHVAERVLISAAGIYLVGRIHFVEKKETFSRDLFAAKPSVFLGVPRIWEKLDEAIQRKLPFSFIRQIMAPMIRKKMGLSRTRLFLSGAAPLSPILIGEFSLIGICIHEVYGMTENLGISTANMPGKVKIGTVGQAFDKMEVSIDPNGEILVLGPTCTIGYYNDESETEKLYKDGLMHTGDCGEIDKDQYLTITGRIKDIFKTSKGVYVSPSPIENSLMSLDFIDQVCVMALNLSQPFALAVLSEKAAMKPQKHIKSNSSKFLNALNKKLSKNERLSKIIFLTEEWTLANSMLTPTLKIKRFEVERRFSKKILLNFHDDDQIIFLGV